MPRSRLTNPWLRFLDSFRIRNGRFYRWRPKQLVQAAAREWGGMSRAEKYAATPLPLQQPGIPAVQIQPVVQQQPQPNAVQVPNVSLSQLGPQPNSVSTAAQVPVIKQEIVE